MRIKRQSNSAAQWARRLDRMHAAAYRHGGDLWYIRRIQEVHIALLAALAREETRP